MAERFFQFEQAVQNTSTKLKTQALVISTDGVFSVSKEPVQLPSRHVLTELFCIESRIVLPVVELRH
jgi:hypothetical protein